MTARRKALRFKGDRRDHFPIGKVMGPGLDGLHRQVTGVTYDRRRKVTLVDVETVGAYDAPEGSRVRYYGDRTGVGPEPAPRAPIEHREQPR